MSRPVYLILLLLLINSSLSAQTIVSGRVLGLKTNLPIPYANVGVPKTIAGSITNPDGSFSMPVPEKLIHDSLTFSAIGFESKKVSIQELINQTIAVVLLQEKVTVLNELVVKGKKQRVKNYELGNKSSHGGVMENDTTYAGRSMALLISDTSETKSMFPVYVKSASLKIFKNNLSVMKFRVRLNEVDSITGEPGDDLINESIVVESQARMGWIRFDLSKLNLVLDRPFYLTFEQILDINDRTAIANGYRDFIRDHPDDVHVDTVFYPDGRKEVNQTFTGKGVDLPGTFIAIDPRKSAEYACYNRESSLGAWTKVRGIISAYVTVIRYE